MASDKSKSIDSMGPEEIFATMKTLGVSFDGVNTIDDMRTRVKAALNRAEKTSSWSAGQVRYLFLSVKFRDNFGWYLFNSLHKRP